MKNPLDLLSTVSFGTVQLGLEYGIANTKHIPDDAASRKVLDAALEMCMTCLDTARGYGDAEDKIGRWREAGNHSPMIVTKFLPLPNEAPVSILRGQVDQSLTALKTDCLDVYMAHRSSDVFIEGVMPTLREIRAEGKINTLGVSVYSEREIRNVLELKDIRVIQAPMNVLDQRLLSSGVLDACEAQGVTVVARSAFLQGSLYLTPDKLPDFLSPMRPALATLRDLIREYDISLTAIALRSLLGRPAVKSIVVGAVSPEQIRESATAVSGGPLPEELIGKIAELGQNLPETVLNPALWPKL